MMKRFWIVTILQAIMLGMIVGVWFVLSKFDIDFNIVGAMGCTGFFLAVRNMVCKQDHKKY